MDATLVAQVAHNIHLDPLPGLPEYFAGVFRYQNTLVPVIDMRRLLENEPCLQAYATRIIIINYEADENHMRFLGLLAENILTAERLDDELISSVGVTNENAPYLESAYASSQGILPIVDAKDILPEEVRRLLFRKLDETIND